METPEPIGHIANSGAANAISILSGVITACLVPAFVCTCGHLDAFALIFTAVLAACAWYAFLLGKATHFAWRVVRIAVVVLLTGVLAKNTADVLWFGHNPLLIVPKLLR
jgi:hypothetical protein